MTTLNCEGSSGGEGAWIQTYTGKRFYVVRPREQDVDINDIAHALSLICRFTGHTSEFYSVCQHSVLVAEQCNDGGWERLYGLLHDASEAYISDLAAPLKHSGMVNVYLVIEKRIQKCIYQKFGLDPDNAPADLKKIDKMMCSTEARDLMHHPLDPDWQSYIDKYGTYPEKVVPWTSRYAESVFLQSFNQYTKCATAHSV